VQGCVENYGDLRAAVKKMSLCISVPPHNQEPALKPNNEYSGATCPPTILAPGRSKDRSLTRLPVLPRRRPLIGTIMLMRNTHTTMRMLQVRIMVTIVCYRYLLNAFASNRGIQNVSSYTSWLCLVPVPEAFATLTFLHRKLRQFGASNLCHSQAFE
jgi:hypothetical protein